MDQSRKDFGKVYSKVYSVGDRYTTLLKQVDETNTIVNHLHDYIRDKDQMILNILIEVNAKQQGILVSGSELEKEFRVLFVERLNKLRSELEKIESLFL